MAKYNLIVETNKITGLSTVWAESKIFFGLISRKQGILFNGELNGNHPSHCCSQHEVDKVIRAFRKRQRLLERGESTVSSQRIEL